MNKNDVTSPIYQGLTNFLRWKDNFLADYGKLAAQQAAQMALYQMDPDMIAYLMLTSPDGVQELMKLAKGE